VTEVVKNSPPILRGGTSITHASNLTKKEFLWIFSVSAMKLEKYGITLNRLTVDKIELVRNWRNDPKIVKYMEAREYITPEAQQKWFETIDNDNNYFFIIEYDKKEIGVVNIKNINYQQQIGEAGIYIYDNAYLNGDVSFRATLCILDFSFEALDLVRVIIHVLCDNKRAIQYNLMFGFEKQPNQEGVYNQLYHLERKRYFEKRAFLTNYIN